MYGSYQPNQMRDVNRRIIEEFRANRGVLSPPWDRGKMLLLTTTGRRSGRPHTVPMMFKERGDTCFVIASNAGSPAHPHWYLNLLAQPRVTVERRAERYEAIARTAEGEERAAMWAALIRSNPDMIEYQRRAGDRTFPLVLLERA